eukprot:CAMPEP_0115505702 /NCGR_PEP_ID=MMETSP0271-20121206/70731_1 /TAXON_ID=71861 /ORGANISM="Scrippsiella trochoidea, Strain CCMP3099" /LENGTH=166 /DNA_ID=CAMNT_0002935039 /DNA_START=322 /DNA_END=822 /DNA_ORIENTATION=+
MSASGSCKMIRSSPALAFGRAEEDATESSCASSDHQVPPTSASNIRLLAAGLTRSEASHGSALACPSLVSTSCGCFFDLLRLLFRLNLIPTATFIKVALYISCINLIFMLSLQACKIMSSCVFAILGNISWMSALVMVVVPSISGSKSTRTCSPIHSLDLHKRRTV